MSNAVIRSCTNIGITSHSVLVETHISNGLPGFFLVGMAEKTVKESKERVRSALLNANFSFPQRRITVNLSPAALPKAGSRFDLAIAISILVSSGQLRQDSCSARIFLGELSLNGALRHTHYLLPHIAHHRSGSVELIIPSDNRDEAACIGGNNIYHAAHLLEVCAHLSEKKSLERVSPSHLQTVSKRPPCQLDWSDVVGQGHAKRGLEIAVAGHHHSLLYGPPGSGKTLLSERLPTIMPKLNDRQWTEQVLLHTLHQPIVAQISREPSMRSPHHTCSEIALVGGGSPIKPGEISLAHHGVLFLDELPEFKAKAIEALREPLERGQITISRSSQHATFPCECLLIAAMNLCPCGQYVNDHHPCRCPIHRIQQYQAKISGPMLDRIDIMMMLSPTPLVQLCGKTDTEHSDVVRQRVITVQERQYQRQGKLNGSLTQKECHAYCQLNDACTAVATQAIQRRRLSARSYLKILKIARTLADMDQCAQIKITHLKEALSYRQPPIPPSTNT